MTNIFCKPRSTLRDYGVAIVCVLVALLVWGCSVALIGNRINSSYFLAAVIVAGRLAGFGPSCLVLVVGMVVNIYGQWMEHDEISPTSTFIVGVHFVLGMIMVGVMNLERTARQKAERLSLDAAARQSQLLEEVRQHNITEQQLQQQREQTDLALQAGGLGTWTWEVGSNSVWWSSTNEAIHGYAPGTFTGTFDDSISHMFPEDREITQSRISRLFSHDEMEPLTYRVHWPDGSTHWIEGRGKLLRDTDGSPLRVLGVCVDVTERRDADEKLRASEERFRQLATHSPVGIVEADAQGRCAYVNDHWCKLAGISAEQAMGDGWTVAVHPDDLARLLPEWEVAVVEGRNYANEARFVKPDGEIVWVHFSCAVVPNRDGSVRAFISTVVDITKRKAAEDALATKEAQLRGILDHTSTVVYLKDSAGKYVVVNRRFYDFVQQTTVVGKSDLELFPESIAQRFQESDANIWRSNTSMEFQEIVPLNGRLHSFRSMKFPVRDAHGRMIALGGVSTDITDLVEKQDLLRNLIDVQEREKQLICYDFHDGLIQYAAGSLMLLESYKINHHPPESSHQLDTAIRSLKAGVTEGRRIIRGIRPTVLDDMGVQAAIEDLVDQLSESGIEVELNFDRLIGRLAPAIEATIYRVVQEALTNARKYSGAERVTVELRLSAEKLYLEVRDFGKGFDVPAARQRGFGLLGMNERVRLLGGECRIESKLNAGTRIIVWLPIAIDAEDARKLASCTDRPL